MLWQIFKEQRLASGTTASIKRIVQDRVVCKRTTSLRKGSDWPLSQTIFASIFAYTSVLCSYMAILFCMWLASKSVLEQPHSSEVNSRKIHGQKSDRSGTSSILVRPTIWYLIYNRITRQKIGAYAESSSLHHNLHQSKPQMGTEFGKDNTQSCNYNLKNSGSKLIVGKATKGLYILQYSQSVARQVPKEYIRKYRSMAR